jgi:hypothetical protein
MTFQDQVKALPEAERIKFFRSIMAVVDAGYAAGVPAEALGKAYADVYREADVMLKERAK